MKRRTFLQALAATPLAAATVPTGLKLGFDTYSLRAFRWKSLELLDFAVRNRLDTMQVSDLGDFESLEPEFLTKFKAAAERAGISIDGGIGSICPTSSGWNKAEGDPVSYLRKGLRVAHAVGATCMRCVMGSGQDRLGPIPLSRHIEETIKVLRAARTEAMDLNVKIAIENHSGDLQGRELRAMIETAGKEFVGACLDTGNPMWVVEDPMVTLEALAPYVVTSHIRDSAVYEHPRGAAAQWTAVGDGSIDMHSLMARFAQLCPKATVQLEIITGRPPRVLPYLEPDFWKAFPDANAAEFARFVALARHGHPFSGEMIIADMGGAPQPPEYMAALKEQQRHDLERSFEYAKHELQLGVRWRS